MHVDWKEKEIEQKQSEDKIAYPSNIHKENNTAIEIEPVCRELSQLSKMVNALKENMQNLESNVNAPSNTTDLEKKAKEMLQSMMNEKDQNSINASEVKELIRSAVKDNKVDELVQEKFGKPFKLND